MRITTYYLIFLMLLMACGTGKNKDEHAVHSLESAEKYTCSMHPQVIQNEPGTCPICGMDLVKINTSETSANALMLTDSQVRLANITTQKVSRSQVGETVWLNGTLTVDKEKSEVITSRAAGRVEKLFIKESGQTIQKGEPLYILYSESLLTLQQEYLLAKEQYETLGKTEKSYASFLKAAETKLLRYGLTNSQVQKLTAKKVLESRVTFLSPATGIVTEVNATEGQYVAEGSMLYRIEDISSLWVEAELYPNETSHVTPGDKIMVNVAGFASPALEATVNFLSPEYRQNSQVTVMRAEIKNPKLQFAPGQQVQVQFMHSAREAISIPVDAVIRDAKGTHVYVQAGHNTFAPRMVETGIEGFESVEITHGLKAGDTVAVTGAYLLYAELILKGTDPMAGHNH